MSDQQQVLRLLATIREEVSNIRTRQEELYEILVSYKDQVQDLKKTVEDGLAGLPTSPYIAGQLVPAPKHIGGADDFRELLATYLHGSPPNSDEPPSDVEIKPPVEIDPKDVKLERDETERKPSRGRRSGGGGGRRERSDPDLSRGPDRDVVALDLDADEGGKKKKKRRRRTRKKKVESADD